MTSELPVLIRFMIDNLKFRLRKFGKAQAFEYYQVDLSSLKLRLSDRTPFIHLHADQINTKDLSEMVLELRTAIQSEFFQKYIPILMVEGVVPELRALVMNYLPYCTLLDTNDIQLIVSGAASEKRLLNVICQYIPISSLSPYEISSPVTGSRFFGREYEIRTILNKPNTNYAIIGVRRIGKTSLMMEIKRRMEENGEGRVLFFDCSDFGNTDSYLQAITSQLDIRQRERMTLDKFPHFLRVKSVNGKKPILFMLDEVDHLIQFDRHNNYELINVLRSSANQGFARYILTGYREVIEESVREKSDMYNFITQIQLGNMDRNDTRRLITVPMNNLGVTFERENEFANQVFQETAGNPNLVQFYCSILTQLLDDQNRRKILMEDLTRVHSNSEFERYLFRTFSSNTDDLEKAIVYSLVKDFEHFTDKDIDISLKKRRVRAKQIDIERACDRLEVAGFLTREGRVYTFAIPVLMQLLKENCDVDYLFSKAREDGKLYQ
jgi:hypothetical protein